MLRFHREDDHKYMILYHAISPIVITRKLFLELIKVFCYVSFMCMFWFFFSICWTFTMSILNNRVEPFMFADAIKLLTYTRCFLLFFFFWLKSGVKLHSILFVYNTYNCLFDLFFVDLALNHIYFCNKSEISLIIEYS